MLEQVQVVVIHYGTPDLLTEAVSSFRAVYPSARLLLIDNGSPDASVPVVHDLAARYDAVAELLPENLFHGPAMHHALQRCDRELVFFLDSDTITRRGGFLEAMAAAVLSEPQCCGAGQVVHVSPRGFAQQSGIPVPASAYMMVRRSTYLSLPPFVHHGLPVLATCIEAARRGMVWIPFPVHEYVEHLGRGTAARYGYGLGWRSRWDFVLSRLDRLRKRLG